MFRFRRDIRIFKSPVQCASHHGVKKTKCFKKVCSVQVYDPAEPKTLTGHCGVNIFEHYDQISHRNRNQRLENIVKGSDPKEMK